REAHHRDDRGLRRREGGGHHQAGLRRRRERSGAHRVVRSDARARSGRGQRGRRGQGVRRRGFLVLPEGRAGLLLPRGLHAARSRPAHRCTQPQPAPFRRRGVPAARRAGAFDARPRMAAHTKRMSAAVLQDTRRWNWLPEAGTWKYHALLLALGIFVLGPLGGVTASYMNFSLGFFIGGQVLAGILGSTVTYGYGAEGKHGANYIQTAAASVASLSAMGVLVQAMVWMGMTQPPLWQMVLYFLCIGMFAAGVGMLYTPILVDRMQLTFPSGLAVANILRALTDPVLLRQSVNKLGSGIGIGIATGLAGPKIALLNAIEFSASTFGAGMVVGARIGIPAMVAGLLGLALVPYFVSIGWLNPGDPFRKI